MRIKILALAGVLTLGALASACTPETTVTTTNQEAPGVRVSGEGSAFGEPDIALITLGVNVEEDTVAAARERAGNAMDAMVQALKDGGVADEDIQTTRFNVEARYNYPLNGEPELRGFAVNNISTVKIRNIDDTGDLIDASLEAGGNLARIESLSFTIDDPSELEDEARRAAMAEARAKADTLASEAGASVGAALSISEGFAARPLQFDEFAAADFALQEGDGGTPIQIGELEVVVNVDVVYELD